MTNKNTKNPLNRTKTAKCAMLLLLAIIILCTAACNGGKNMYKEESNVVETSVEKLRDPCVLVENGVYYMYGTGWRCYKNTSGKLSGGWIDLGVVAEIPYGATDNYWAPEVHKYKGKYYMFTTYFSTTTNVRGCTVMRADSPEGPFVEISDGQITADEGYYAIDGTFYVDEQGQPWMVYVREWVGTLDRVGKMMAVKLSDDLTRFVSEPIELFRADEPEWAVDNITDGCWLYKCKNGELLMLWSNFNANGYCVAVAKSSNGRIDGEWTHEQDLLYSGEGREFDGGHGMIFTALDGSKFLSIHSPNAQRGDRKEKPVFYRVEERDGSLVLVE